MTKCHLSITFLNRPMFWEGDFPFIPERGQNLRIYPDGKPPFAGQVICVHPIEVNFSLDANGRPTLARPQPRDARRENDLEDPD